MSDLYKESDLGRRYQEAWDNYVAPFFTAKSEELFEAFKQCPTTNEKGLITIKLQLNCLDMLRDNFQHYIDTGKMAQLQIDEFEQNQTQK
jgi:hypothetical protein